MKLISCFSDLREIDPLIDAGADELYCAVEGIPHFGPGCLPSLRHLEKAVRRVHARRRRISLAANAINHIILDVRDCRRLLRNLLAADRIGVDALIIASPTLLHMLQEFGRPLRAERHLSSVQPVFNRKTLEFFLPFGLSRLILPNQLSPLEADGLLELCRDSSISTELFDYRFFGCVYVNGRCDLHNPNFHTFRSDEDGGALCRIGPGARSLDALRPFNVLPARSNEVPALGRRLALRMGCGGPARLATAATFFDFLLRGVDYLKYGTRPDPARTKVWKVREARRMIARAETLLKAHGAAGPLRRPGSPPAQAAREEFVEHMSGWGRRS